jgi:hypothetical protein
MNQPNTQLRTYARIAGIMGILAYLIYLFVIILPALLDKSKPNTTADTAILGFLIVGYMFAWFKENEGGIMLMFITVVIGLSYYYQDPAENLVISLAVCIPLFISGLLFYTYYRKELKK